MPLLVDRPALWDVGCGTSYGTFLTVKSKNLKHCIALFQKRTFMKQPDSGNGMKIQTPSQGVSLCRISV